MGNVNHKMWYGDKKRKVLLLGLEQSGKTTFLHWLKTGAFDVVYNPTKDLEMENIKKKSLDLLIFDPAGGERQRVFWRHHFTGTQGIVFFIDVSGTEDEKAVAARELSKIVVEKELDKIPILVILNKSDLIPATTKETEIENLGLTEALKDTKRIHVVLGSIKAIKGIKEGLEWLSKTMVAI